MVTFLKNCAYAVIGEKSAEPGTRRTAVGANAFFDKKTTNPHIMPTLKLVHFTCQKCAPRTRETMVGAGAALRQETTNPHIRHAFLRSTICVTKWAQKKPARPW